MAAVIIAAALLVVVFAAGFWFANYSMGIQRQTLEQARAWQEAHYDLSWYDRIDRSDYTVDSYDGYALHAQMLANPVATDRYILISHGYTDNRFGALKYARMYLDLGFNVIVYDLRGHGENAETFCTYSARERRDLQALILESRQRYGDMAVLGLHGESLGAATSLAVLEFQPPVDFVVADCGFSNIRDVLADGVRSRHLPAAMVDVASLCAKVRFGYGYADMRPIDCLAGNAVPILFIHGAADGFIAPAHSESMSRATAGYSELHLIDDAGHAESILVNPEAYREYVAAFLDRVLSEPPQTNEVIQ